MKVFIFKYKQHKYQNKLSLKKIGVGSKHQQVATLMIIFAMWGCKKQDKQIKKKIWHFSIENISYDLEKKIGEGEDNGNTYVHIL